MRQYLDMQHEHDCYFFIANLHALTSVRDGDQLRELTYACAADYLALGLDPEKATIFVQSDLAEVNELAWILTTVTPMGLLQRCHAYKDKIAQGISADHGLFAYPVLMAADILIHNPDLVPVGQDQKQHVEVTRDIADKFNGTYTEIFKLPDPYIVGTTAMVPGVDGRKMSKSYGNAIGMFEPEKALRKKVMGIKTDSIPVEDPKDPDKCNVFALFKLFADDAEREAMAARYREGGIGYGDAKKRLFELLMDHFRDARTRREELENDRAYVEKVLADGAERARASAIPCVEAVRKAVGL